MKLTISKVAREKRPALLAGRFRLWGLNLKSSARERKVLA
ncbi:hypothetical protein C4K17_6436 [Pseudomonas chlororaphis subsp. aurantiaca]|nr:hypothetical protein C4K17_6436 [Pseudomonas chlororaphis subsp. aurantiaca]